MSTDNKHPIPPPVGTLAGICPACGSATATPIHEGELKTMWGAYTTRRRRTLTGWPKGKPRKEPKK
jgi:hypothetical protein